MKRRSVWIMLALSALIVATWGNAEPIGHYQADNLARIEAAIQAAE